MLLGSFASLGLGLSIPLIPMQSCDLCRDWRCDFHEAVQTSDADLNLSDLSVEGLRHKACRISSSLACGQVTVAAPFVPNGAVCMFTSLH